jgi:hypothetical protein
MNSFIQIYRQKITRPTHYYKKGFETLSSAGVDLKLRYTNSHKTTIQPNNKGRNLVLPNKNNALNIGLQLNDADDGSIQVTKQ